MHGEKRADEYGAYSKGQFLKFNKVRYLPTGKGRRAVKLLVLFSLQALLLWTQKLFFMAIYLLSQMRYIFAACHASYAQKRYNLPCGRLRYDINPLHAPQGISHRRYIARDSVYRKSRKGFISLRSVLKGHYAYASAFLVFIGFFLRSLCPRFVDKYKRFCYNGVNGQKTEVSVCFTIIFRRI